MLKSEWMTRSLVATVMVLGLAACESAPQPAASSSSSGGMGSGNTSMATAPSRGVGTGSLEDMQRQFSVEAGDRVLFDYDSFALKSNAPAILDKQAAWLKQNGQFRIVIEGHADERGTREYNLALAERRATTVRNYLANQGIPGARMSTISYGKERPVALGSNDAAWAQNRRGVTVLAN